MIKIDFDTEKVFFNNGNFKWYVDPYFNKYLRDNQAINLPSLNELGCFVVKGLDTEDYVLIDNRQNVVASYSYNNEGFDKMQCKINILKIAKHYELSEKNDI